MKFRKILAEKFRAVPHKLYGNGVVCVQKHVKSAMRKLSQMTDIPADTLLGEPTFVFYGYRELTIDRHIAILEYSEEKIVVSLHGGLLTICGDGLELKQMVRDSMTVVGKIRSLEIEEA